MANKLAMKVKTDKDILNEYLVKYQPTEADLQEAFGVSRQMIWNYKTGVCNPGAVRLGEMAKRADWVGDMAREMLALRGLSVTAPLAVTAEAA